MLRKKAEIMRKPEWLKLKIQGDKNTTDVESMLEGLKLNTVCHEANCPNKMECYSRNCTRNCTFCNVTRHTPDPINLEEPENLAKAVQILGLKHAVVTSVTRDDLPDEGANQFAEVVRQV